MGGGLMQLVAYGAQDVYLTGNPQITFFKVVYRRHTNFAMEAIEQVFTGNVTLGKKTSCTIARNGDLVGRMYLEVDIKTNAKKEVNIGHAIIDNVEIEIGGQKIDKQYGEWMNIWTQLSESTEGLMKHCRLIDGSLKSVNCPENSKLYIPLQFWFNRNPGLALPLIALQYHEVKLNVMFNKAKTGSALEDATLENVCLFCDYIFLDTDERRRFAQVSHEYLIEQVQFNGRTPSSGSIHNIELRFNHPCKEIVWVGLDDFVRDKKPFKFDGENGEDLCTSAVLQLNGHDRFREREGTYFRTVQPYQHHTGFNSSSKGDKDGKHSGIYCYSFALNPEEHQPSGTCNFSRIDNAVLTLDSSGYDAMKDDVDCNEWHVYATNYNVLRIMSGMGGLAYSN